MNRPNPTVVWVSGLVVVVGLAWLQCYGLSFVAIIATYFCATEEKV